MKILLFFTVFILVACTNQKDLSGYDIHIDKTYIEYLSSLELPDSLDFCGERVPLEIPEVRERAEREFYLLLQQPGQIILYLKRSGRYFPLFERILAETQMPDDIKYLSVAESALYMARSSKDAVGLWQFIPETAKAMGLIINDFVDERRHPEKSTYAAIKYLKMGYSNHKSWLLTAAGYNMGHHNIIENINFQGKDNYFDLLLNEETSRYIFRIVCIKEIMKHSEKYGFKIRDDRKYKQENVKIIEWDKEINNLSEWAKQYNTTYKDIKLMNPWILKRSLPTPTKGHIYRIYIPE